MVKEIWKSFFHRLPAGAKHMVKEIFGILFPLPSRKREAHGEGVFRNPFLLAFRSISLSQARRLSSVVECCQPQATTADPQQNHRI
jgi:hypothetical protein